MSTTHTAGTARIIGTASIVYGALAVLAGVMVYAAPATMKEIAFFITGQDVLGRALEGGAAGVVSFGCIPLLAGTALLLAGIGLLRSAAWGRSWAMVSAAVMIGNNIAWAIVVGLGLTAAGVDGLVSTTMLQCAYPAIVVATLAARPEWASTALARRDFAPAV